jgi:hypothetical protein
MAGVMTDRVRIIPHALRSIPDSGSFEVWFADGRPSQYFYWDDNPGRASTTRKMDQSQAKEAARALARAERDKLEHTCSLCDGSGWVCEEHPDQPWQGPHACTCGAAARHALTATAPTNRRGFRKASSLMLKARRPATTGIHGGMRDGGGQQAGALAGPAR